MEEQAIALSMKLAEAVGRSSLSWVSDKRAVARGKKDAKEQQELYEEIISKLLEDKSEIEMVARQYKDMYEKVSISDDDIEHLQNTINKVIDSLYKTDEASQKFNPKDITNLINKDTLKTMQLLGFNYKEAIGGPLTEACADTIRNKLSPHSGKHGNAIKKNK